MRHMLAEVSFGEWLKRQRKAAGLTQEQLARQISYSTSALKKIEAEERRPSTQIAGRLAEIFHIPQHERTAFLRFARDDWRAAPMGVEKAPWLFPQNQERKDQSRLNIRLFTFLFTDIEDSTKLSQQYPDAMPGLLARHHEILNRSIKSYNGHVFEVAGDSFAAAFDSPSHALNAAMMAQRNLQNESWSPASIKVRMGIHTGEAQPNNASIQDPYSGYTTLALTQRIMSAGHGGHILLSNATEALLRGGFPKQVELRDMGEYKFKDVFQPVHIFQILASDLRKEFPALRALDVLPNNLPVQLTSFMGRERELVEVQQLLSKTRLLTLTGPGDTGKTRHSLQLAQDLLPSCVDGVWLIELAPLADSRFIVPAIASVFELREMPNMSILDIVTDYLLAKQLLLILDNCEHLIEACAKLSDHLLHTCPQLKIIASSREAHRTRALNAIGLLGFGKGDLLGVTQVFEEVVDLSHQTGEKRSLTQALTCFVNASVYLGFGERGYSLAEEALRLVREVGDKVVLGMALINMAGIVAMEQGDLKTAQAYREEGLQLLKEQGSRWAIAFALFGLGRFAGSQGNYAEARARFEACLPLFVKLNDRLRTLMVQSESAHLERQRGHFAQAQSLYRETILGQQNLGHRAAIAHQFECFAFIAKAEEKEQRAARLFGATEALREDINTPMTPFEGVEYDCEVNDLRLDMDEATFAKAWAEGRAMSMKQAILLATETES